MTTQADKNAAAHEAGKRLDDTQAFHDALCGHNGSSTRHEVLRHSEKALSKEEKRKRDQELAMLLCAEYQAAHQRVVNALAQLEAAIYEAMTKAKDGLYEVNQRYDAALKRAMKTDDGKLALWGDDGRVYFANGQALSAQEASELDWRDNSLSISDYQAATAERDQAKQEYARIAGLDQQTTAIRSEIEDEDSRPSLERMSKLEDKLSLIGRSLAVRENQTATLKLDGSPPVVNLQLGL